MDRKRISISDYEIFRDEVIFLSDKVTSTKERAIWEENSHRFRWTLLSAIKSIAQWNKERYALEEKEIVLALNPNEKLDDEEINLLFALTVQPFQNKC